MNVDKVVGVIATLMCMLIASLIRRGGLGGARPTSGAHSRLVWQADQPAPARGAPLAATVPAALARAFTPWLAQVGARRSVGGSSAGAHHSTATCDCPRCGFSGRRRNIDHPAPSPKSRGHSAHVGAEPSAHDGAYGRASEPSSQLLLRRLLRRRRQRGGRRRGRDTGRTQRERAALCMAP